MAIPSYISEAYNSGALVTGVNPQTGSFHASVTLAEVSAGIQDPIRFALNLSIGPQTLAMSSLFVNYDGYYAALNIPRIDINANRIYMSDGSVEELVNAMDNSSYTFRSKKLKSIKISKIFEPNDIYKGWPRFTVEYKGGVAEHYNRAGLIERIVSPTGHYIQFTHDENSNYCYLIQACSGTSTDAASPDILSQLRINYNDDGMPDNIEKTWRGELSTITEITDIISSDLEPGRPWYITGIYLPGDDGMYTFDYETVISANPKSLARITTPNGGDYSVTYHPETTQKYGNVSDVMQYVAVVSSFRAKTIPVSNNTQNDEVHLTFTYGDLSESDVKKRENNFTGYDATISNYTPNPATDNCFWKTTDYTYTTVETNESLTPRIIIKRTYNRFHLLISETITRDSSEYYRETTQYTYGNMTPSVDINGQTSPKYMLWTSGEKKYEKIKEGAVVAGQTRTEIRTCVHDDWGNLTSDKAPSGIEHQYVWYPAAGEADKCDAAPFDMPAYLKLLTIIPDQAATVKPASKTKRYTYSKVSGNNSSYTLPPSTYDPLGLPVTVYIYPFGLYPKEVTENDVLMATCAYKAPGTTFQDRLLTGALLSTTHTLSTTDSSSPPKTTTVVTQQLNSWNINNNFTTLTHGRSITSQETVTTGSNPPVIELPETRRGEETEYRLADGRLEKRITPADSTEADSAKNETAYSYDAENRLVKIEDFFNHSEYKETENISYTPFSSATNGVVVTNSRGNATETTTYNYKMLPVAVKHEVTGLSSATQSYRYAADGKIIRSQLRQYLFRSPDDTTESEINTVTRYQFDALEEKVETPSTGLFNQGYNPANPDGVVLTDRADGSPVRFEQVYNKYGQMASTRQYQFSNNEMTDPQNLTSNDYDGFGRLIKTKTFTGVNSENTTDYSQVDYTYDAFDRLASETVSHVSTTGTTTTTEKMHKTEYQYTNALFSFKSPVSVKYGKPDANNVLPSDATTSSQTWDAFGRLTEQKTKKIELGNDKSIITTHIYTNNTFDRPEKTTVNNSSTNVSYTYEPVIGTPLTMVLNNTTGVNQPLSTSVAFTYNKTDKQLSAATVKYSPADNVDSQTIRNQYALTYKGKGIVDKCTFSCVKTDENGTTAATSLSTELAYDFSVRGQLQKLTYKLDNTLLLTKSLGYLWSAERCGLASFNFPALSNAINIMIRPVTSGPSNSLEKNSVVYLTLKGFYSDTDVYKAKISSACTYEYDIYGREINRVYYNGNKGGNLICSTVFDVHERIITRSLNLSKGNNTPSKAMYENSYTYLNKGSAVPLQHSVQTLKTNSTNTETLATVDYTFNSATKFSTVNNLTTSINDTYTYIHDAVKGMTTSSPANTALALEYNEHGNVETVTGTGGNADKGAKLTYNIFNQPAVFNKFNHEQADITKQWSPTTYEYDAFNRVCKITTRDYPTATASTSVFLIYDGDNVLAEIEATNTTTEAGLITASTIVSRCVYLWVENMILGRVLETELNTTPRTYLDVYMMDSSGSVRGVTRYRYGVLSTDADAVVTTFFDYTDYGDRTDITDSVPAD